MVLIQIEHVFLYLGKFPIDWTSVSVSISPHLISRFESDGLATGLPKDWRQALKPRNVRGICMVNPYN